MIFALGFDKDAGSCLDHLLYISLLSTPNIGIRLSDYCISVSGLRSPQFISVGGIAGSVVCL